MSGRLAHEIANHDQFADYYEKQLPTRLNERNKTKIYKELASLLCNYPSHKYHIDCPNHCYNAILSLNADYIQKSQTLKTIYLELLRDYEYEHNIVINDNNA
jgi:hypothetical protein